MFFVALCRNNDSSQSAQVQVKSTFLRYSNTKANTVYYSLVLLVWMYSDSSKGFIPKSSESLIEAGLIRITLEYFLDSRQNCAIRKAQRLKYQGCLLFEWLVYWMNSSLAVSRQYRPLSVDIHAQVCGHIFPLCNRSLITSLISEPQSVGSPVVCPLSRWTRALFVELQDCSNLTFILIQTLLHQHKLLGQSTSHSISS